ncbi:hypothetical protein ALC57_04768 [Trachymyrmex cornetzi]|uniref:Uncharacterized protein n=1 Tax=Trachymyrmex cornetzi TaxID=471704 RepID=A0A195ECN6_9HYME|nr:hypothetical protein ALC57_04768 [Trachymyrmex cornetzi]
MHLQQFTRMRLEYTPEGHIRSRGGVECQEESKIGKTNHAHRSPPRTNIKGAFHFETRSVNSVVISTSGAISSLLKNPRSLKRFQC